MKTALISGAATGIGRALAQRLDDAGWRVLAGIHRTPPEELLADASDRLIPVVLDVSDDKQVAEGVARIERDLAGDGIDLMVCNAGITGAPGPLECLDLDEFRYLMDVNFWGPLRMTRGFLPLLRRQSSSRIIVVSSVSFYMTIPIGSTYPVSKSAVGALARHLRIELAPFGIEVTELRPGGVETRMTEFPEQEEIACWDAVPSELATRYQEKFEFPGRVLKRHLALESPESFAEKIYSRVVLARRLKPIYNMGKGSSTLSVLHQLPAAAKEAVWRRFFNVSRP